MSISFRDLSFSYHPKSPNPDGRKKTVTRESHGAKNWAGCFPNQELRNDRGSLEDVLPAHDSLIGVSANPRISRPARAKSSTDGASARALRPRAWAGWEGGSGDSCGVAERFPHRATSN